MRLPGGLARRFPGIARVDGRLFALLLGAGLAGVAAILPFAFELIRFLPAEATAGREMPLGAIVALALVQNGLLLALAILAGLVAAERAGFEMPLLRAWTSGTPAPPAMPIVAVGLAVGLATGVAMVAIEALAFLDRLPEAMTSIFAVPLWKRLLGGVVYGGITEELLMRLCLVSLFSVLFGRWWRTPQGRPTSGAIGAAIFVVALLFGLGHLPATSAIAPLTPILVARALVLNGVAGLTLGWIYWRRGLEAAMIAHAAVHLVLQVPGAILLERLL
jgi:membrane protease YdiL (CAAX protease family)